MSSLELIEKHFLKRLAREEYYQLKRDSEKYALKDKHLEEFFGSLHGYRVLQWTTNICCDSAALNFLCENIPLNFLEQSLKFAKFAVLKNFLKIECNVDDSDEVDNMIIVEKLKLLIKIAPKPVEQFMLKHRNKKWMNEQIQKTYTAASNG